MADYVRGKFPALKPLPDEIQEYILVKQTGWTLDYIRSLNVKDHDVMSLLSIIDERFDAARQEQLASRPTL